MTRLIQIQQGIFRRVGLVEEPRIRLLDGVPSIMSLACAAIESNSTITSLIEKKATGEILGYDPIYSGKSEWRLLPAIDHPDEATRCLVSGTGLTHLGSAKNRDSMHTVAEAQMTDSMKMFRWGVEGGKPANGGIGTAPEWFYKGSGTILRAHGERLLVPPYAEDGGEEAEIAGIYYIGPGGEPHRIGMAIGNEFSDHVFERRNYLNLAGSKIRTCAIGPELVIDPDFRSVRGKAIIERAGRQLWSKDITTGESEMCHSLANIEHHHFKFDTHRRPGDLHVHYFGACAISYGDGIKLADGDIMTVSFDGFGRPLRNPVSLDTAKMTPITVRPLA